MSKYSYSQASESLPDGLLDLIAAKFRMLSDSSRLAILRVLMKGERNVGQIVSETARTQANVSKHLKMLTQAGFVARRKDGLQVFYRIDDPIVVKLCHLVCDTILKDIEEQWESQRKLLKRRRAKPSR